jgi:hypothetical protein
MQHGTAVARLENDDRPAAAIQFCKALNFSRGARAPAYIGALRSREPGMFIWSRYFATVRRDSFIPSFIRILTT